MSLTNITDNLVSFASQIDQNTVDQAKGIASMPFVWPHVALMPDAHLGKGSSVGTVIPTKGAVIPAACGVDIGCGMIAAKTRFTLDEIVTAKAELGAPLNLADLREAVEDAIPLSPGNYNKNNSRFPWTRARHEELIQLADRDNVDLSHSGKWMEQLGSLGGGNHFIELCIEEEGEAPGTVWLFLHSGSRGVGNKIAQKHIKVAVKACEGESLPDRDAAYLIEGTPEFDAYIRELGWAQRFALLNREEMMDRFAWAFARWLGVEKQRVEEPGGRVNTHHNYTVPIEIDGVRVWLTRKGAIDASEGKMGLIPGSMGTASYVVRGSGNVTGLFSAPHGAGRRFSRTAAKKEFTLADLEKAMEGIEYRHGEQWIDEIPGAYKDIDVVMEDAKDLVTVVAKLKQIMNVKGT